MAIRSDVNPYPELKITITVRVDETLAAIAPALARGLETAADAIVADARQRCPVVTGFLRDSIQIDPPEDPLKLTIRAAANYAGFVDQGTARAAARPFFTPAVDQGRLTLAQAIEKAVREALNS